MTTERRRNADFIRELIAKRSLSHQRVADLCRVSIHTMRAWMKPPFSKSSTPAPDMAVELLCLKLGEPVPTWLGAVHLVGWEE